jgi:hypothetical protein
MEGVVVGMADAMLLFTNALLLFTIAHRSGEVDNT